MEGDPIGSITSHGMQSPAEECGQQQVSQWLPSEGQRKPNVKRELGDEIQTFPEAWRLWIDEKRSQGVKQELKRHPQHLRNGVRDPESLHFCGEININAIHALEAVMIQVVFLESDTHRHADGEIRKYSQESIIEAAGEGKVVAELVDGEKEIVVAEGAKDIGDENYERPAGKRHAACRCNLN